MDMSAALPKKRLGRGLAALIGDDEPEVPVAQVVPAATSGLRIVPIELIQRNPNNPRKSFNPDELQQLADSLRSKGLLQPLVVRPLPNGQTGYELVAGERRWRASQIAQIHSVPVVVREMDDRESLEIALIENIQRSDLNPLEEAAAYRQLLEQYNYTQQQLAEGLGKSRSHITNTMRLLSLPVDIQSKITDGTLTAGHARTLVAAEAPHELADQIIQLGLSVRQAEDLVRNAPGGSAAKLGKLAHKDVDTRNLEKELSSHLGLTVEIAHKGDKGGKIAISYSTLEQLEDVMRRLKS
jgi:ParB family transcriptional regulator, chromosome partitioning protein